MAEKEPPLFGEIHDDLKSLAAELGEMAAARWELARLELLSQRDQASRLAVVCLLAAVMALTALPLLVWCLADALSGWHHISRAAWLIGISLGLLLLAAVSGFGAVRRFRRQASGLQETLEELHEDVLWLCEWTGSPSRLRQSETPSRPPERAS